MSVNKSGGGNKTNINGLKFEQETSLNEALLCLKGYSIREHTILYNNKEIGLSVSQTKLYTKFLKEKGINYKDYVSKQYRPDEALYLYSTNTIYIIEKKFQHGCGSVDEKLQTCDFKKSIFTKLLAPLNINVEYIYVLNDWFKRDCYNDVLEYIISKNCYYYYNEIPLTKLPLPHNKISTNNFI